MKKSNLPDCILKELTEGKKWLSQDIKNAKSACNDIKKAIICERVDVTIMDDRIKIIERLLDNLKELVILNRLINRMEDD
jgi:hypothetical protein